jgi:uncharacterized protein YwqG
MSTPAKLDLPDELRKHQRVIESYALPAISFSLRPGRQQQAGSHLGGAAYLPSGFKWPVNNGRKLDLLLQVEMRDLAPFPCAAELPKDGTLTFFYDLKELPWGYDPKALAGAKVVYTPSGVATREYSNPNPAEALAFHSLAFQSSLTVPQLGSRAWSRLSGQLGALSEDEERAYLDFARHAQSGPSAGGPDHRFLGHSNNIQNDMQLEAQLVSNGLYCGDETGYKDPRARQLEAGADDWLLLLQLDSQEDAGMMWGDLGMLYFWIRQQDLAARLFDRTWMTLQCS